MVMTQSISVTIEGTGSYLPKNILLNDDLARMVDTSDEWIVRRSGIRQRHIAAPGELTSDLATHAARAALDAAAMNASSVDLIILATATPDRTFPASAVAVQAKIGMERGMAFDIQAVCSGFIYALATADAYLRSGLARSALVIGAETFSRIVDWEDRATCVLFGDGAGAVVLKARENKSSEHTNDARGVLSCHLRSDGRMTDLLHVDGGPSMGSGSGSIRMRGREIFKFATTKIHDVVEAAFERNGITGRDLDWFVPHQANQRIILASARKFDITPEKIIMTVDRHANTSAASIPLALDVAVRDGRIQRGQLVLLEALGGGLTWGAALLRW